jgi:transposase InsO family protein
MNNRSFNLGVKNEHVNLSITENSKSMLWHKRLGHFNYATLKKMADHEMVFGLPDIQEQKAVCEACQLGKQTRIAFNENSFRATCKLQLVFTDVCGPMRTESLNGAKYFLLFIDDYSRYCWVYFLKTKGEVFDVFVKFKAATEREAETKLKALRSDNGGEFTSHKLDELLEKEGIKHQLTIPYTPQQNGVCERRNRTLMEMARCLLFEKKMPLKFWAEAVSTASYLLNRMVTKVLGEKTPYELWHGYKPNVEHLRVFGSPCFYLLPEVNRGKLDQKAELGILLGYSTKSSGYKVFDLKSNKAVIARNVRVDEDKI